LQGHLTNNRQIGPQSSTGSKSDLWRFTIGLLMVTLTKGWKHPSGSDWPFWYFRVTLRPDARNAYALSYSWTGPFKLIGAKYERIKSNRRGAEYSFCDRGGADSGEQISVVLRLPLLFPAQRGNLAAILVH